MTFPEIRNPEQYVASYAALAHALGSGRTAPQPDELALLDATATGRNYHHGSLSTKDMFFLTGVVSILQPRAALEIGTASGASAALLAQVIALGYRERGEPLAATLLHTIDRKDRCLFDEGRPIGFQVAEIAPALAGHVQMHPLQDSSLAPSLFGRGELPFAFIDGNHQHPWPLIDVLHCLPLMPAGSWLVLDDINLPDLRPGPETRFGPRYVFEAWPAATIPGWNVGAVQVPAERQLVRDLVAALLEKPFEVKETSFKRYRKQIAALLDTL